jgi:hypothetical protein
LACSTPRAAVQAPRGGQNARFKFRRVVGLRVTARLLAEGAFEGDFFQGALEYGELLIVQSRDE